MNKYHRTKRSDVKPLGPLTLQFDRATLLILKIDMRHEAYRYGMKY